MKPIRIGSGMNQALNNFFRVIGRSFNDTFVFKVIFYPCVKVLFKIFLDFTSCRQSVHWLVINAMNLL